MTRRPQLIAMGDNCLDVYLSKDRMAVGGNALNVAAQWRLMGLPARYFGVVGEDSEGDVILDGLAGVGLSPEDIERRPGSTAVTLIRDKNGDRSFLLEDLGVGFGYVPDADRQAEMLAADWLHLGTNTDAGLVCLLVSEGARFSVDVSTRHDDLPLAGVPLAFASGPEDPSEPIEPVLAASQIVLIARSTSLSFTTTSIFTLGMKSTTYSAPRYVSLCPFCRPKPRTSATVIPSILAATRAALTSSSLKCRMMASTFFMRVFQFSIGMFYRVAPVAASLQS